MLVTTKQGLFTFVATKNWKCRLGKTEKSHCDLVEFWCFILTENIRFKCGPSTSKLCDNPWCISLFSQTWRNQIISGVFFCFVSQFLKLWILKSYMSLEPEGCGSVGRSECSQLDQKSATACKCHHTHNYRN